MGVLYTDNWQPGDYYFVIIFCMILFQVIIIIWNILISTKIFSSFDDTSNIVAGNITSGADVRFASRPSSDYPTVRPPQSCVCKSGFGPKRGFLGNGMSEGPVLWDIGDVQMTDDMQAANGFDNGPDKMPGRWNTEYLSDKSLIGQL